MSGTYGNFTPRENWQRTWDEWNVWQPYLRDSRPAWRSLYRRAPAPDPRWLFEDRPTGRPSGLASSSSPAPTHSPERFLIGNDTSRNTYSTYRQPVPDSPPSYYEPRYSPPSELESNFTKEEQEKALNKLRKVMINPHLSNIVRRMGMKYKTDGKNQSTGSGNFQDEDGKRCSICLDDFDSKQFVMLTPCNHMFHEDCIVPWVKSQGKCPVCRFVISERNASSENNSRRAALERELMSFIWEFRTL
ncbi:unnamed protein product [Fraxinus pennsylvanica]|uniref:RING-type E3 ubiquitin transferase n=1 Tax=Fraxinus pennsylvanica TaxID=56036 RepID=A0AAD2DKD5_9LAMI|nr:unnamed protein product [Fraxinus pennsylvanica]